LGKSIPLVDLRAQYAAIKDEIDEAIARVIDSGAFILGPEVASFEEEFAAYCEAHFAVGVSSGSSALMLTLLALGVGPGDEVVTSPLTFAATAEAITHCGARIRFVDVSRETANLDPAEVGAAIGPKTRAIIAVHLYGQPANMTAILDLAKRRGIAVIEDAAQAHGARYFGRRVGGLADAACFSFFPAKNLGAYGDGGIVTTNNPDIANKIRLLRVHGQVSKYDHDIQGFGERLDAIQAAVLRVKLRHLDGWNGSRRRHAERYRQNLRDLPLDLLGAREPGAEHVFHLLVAVTDRRDQLMTYLGQQGIATGLHYPKPLHLQRAFADLDYGRGDFPNAELLASHVVSLPMYPELTDEQVNRVCDSIAEEHRRRWPIQ
jgi:dTDP-4-amino-4,6-dideoxygalactose transaminase